MDSLTHTLTGLALSHAGFNRKTRLATLAIVVGANLPDVDYIARLVNTTTFLEYHRGITHSILGVTGLAGLLALALYQWGRRLPPRKNAPELNGFWLFLSCWAATASHLLLDFTNSYGVRPFLPFSGRWYAWDIVFIFDPVILALLGAGLGLPAILRLASEEVGAGKPGLRRGAIFSLCALIFLWGLRDVSHRRVLNLLDSHVYGNENPRRTGAFPSPANPFAWTGVVETDSGYRLLEASALDDDVNPESGRNYRKAPPSPALQAAMKTRTVSVFSGFGRFLWARVEQTEDGYAVSIHDLRFMSPESSHRAFVAEIEFDKNLRVVSEEIYIWGRPKRF